MPRLFKIEADQLVTTVQLYQVLRPGLTPMQIWGRWKAGKLNLLKDYKVWPKEKYLKLWDK